MKTLSSLFKDLYGALAQSARADMIKSTGAQSPIVAGGFLIAELFQSPPMAMVNVGTCFMIWLNARNRQVWRIPRQTAAAIQDFNIQFIPETPPPAWQGDCVVIESATPKDPLIHNYFSIACYRTKAATSNEIRYFFVALDLDGGAAVFSISADMGRFNADLAETDRLFNQVFLEDMEFQTALPPDKRDKCAGIIRFVFAGSYLAESPRHMASVIQPAGGKKKTSKKKKKSKGKGKDKISRPFWSYRNLRYIQTPDAEPSGEGKPLDKEGLDLKPVMVSPHVRQRDGKIQIIDAYASHRWKRRGGGFKVTL